MLERLLTEQSHTSSFNLDRLPSLDLVELMNQADSEVAAAVRIEIPRIAAAIDAIAERLRQNGRLVYIGAGTSGRLGVLDASECPPTFNVSPDLVCGIIAGGETALTRSIEAVEDDSEAGIRDLAAAGFSSRDALVGISASGRTPYVLGAIRRASKLGALTCGISCTPNSELSEAVEFPIEPKPGPEILAGSTRLRAGTATKMVLNMISTGVMIRLGYVYGNLMVNVQPTNQKLADRSRRILAEAASIPVEQASELLARAGSVKTAIVMAKLGILREEAERRLDKAQGRIGDALNG